MPKLKHNPKKPNCKEKQAQLQHIDHSNRQLNTNRLRNRPPPNQIILIHPIINRQPFHHHPKFTNQRENPPDRDQLIIKTREPHRLHNIRVPFPHRIRHLLHQPSLTPKKPTHSPHSASKSFSPPTTSVSA